MKKCPYCGEKIRDAAIKCRFCASFINKPDEDRPGETQLHPAVIYALAAMFIAAYLLGGIVFLMLPEYMGSIFFVGLLLDSFLIINLLRRRAWAHVLMIIRAFIAVIIFIRVSMNLIID